MQGWESERCSLLTASIETGQDTRELPVENQNQAHIPTERPYREKRNTRALNAQRTMWLTRNRTIRQGKKETETQSTR